MPMNNLNKLMEELNGRPLKNVPDVTSDVIPNVTNPTTKNRRKQTITLEDVADGTVIHPQHGPGYYHMEAPAESLEAEATLIHKRFLNVAGHPDSEAVERLAHACKSQRISPDEIVFLDLETTGLGMTPVFLIGTMECTPDGLVFKQYFARNYSEEVSILSAFAKRMESARLVISFNGKTFDMPFLLNRASANGINFPQAEFHLDLLHEARRMYRGQLPNCKLQTLERHICGRIREDDIPGAEIPAAYNEFVRTGNAKKIGAILTHNLYDILTMADLMHRMWYR